MNRDRLAFLITVIWGASILTAVLLKETEVVAIVTPVMVVVSGFFFTRNGNGRSNGK